MLRPLSLLLPLLLLPLSPARATSNPRYQVDSVSHGLKLSLILAQRSYPENALVRVGVRVENVSAGTALLQQPTLCSLNPEVEVVAANHKILYPPAVQGGKPATCSPRRSSLHLLPGHHMLWHVLVILRANRLRVVVLLQGHGEVKGRLMSVSLTADPPPRVTIRTTPTVYAEVHPPGSVDGYMYYNQWWRCRTFGTPQKAGGTLTTGLGPTFLATSASRLVPDWDPTCSSFREWHAVVGWLNQPAATINYVNHQGPTGIQLQPRSQAAERGKAYPYRLYTHCGVDYAVDFDASFWDLADPAWAGSNGNPPVGIGNPYQDGTMTLLDAGHARFDFSGGTIHFTRHIGPKIAPLCS